MKYYARHAVTLLSILLSIQVTGAQTPAEGEGEGEAVKLADAIRDFDGAFGDVVDGKMTPTQIAEFERLLLTGSRHPGDKLLTGGC